MSTDHTELEAEIKVLRAKARDRLDDSFLGDEDYDFVTDDGEKMRETVRPGKNGAAIKDEMNISKMYAPAPSTTNTVDVLVMEAELLANGKELENPHIPQGTKIRDEALSTLRAKNLEPAWRVHE